MIQEIPVSDALRREIEICRVAASGLAHSIRETRPHGKRKRPKAAYAKRILARAGEDPENYGRALSENSRLIRTAEKQVLEFASGLDQLPLAVTETGKIPRVSLIARVYLDTVGGWFAEETCAAFLDSFQNVAVLEMGEIWALKPAAQLELLEHLESAEPAQWQSAVDSLRHVGETTWKDLFEAVSRVDRELRRDPVNAYGRMDFESRDQYRKAIGKVAKHSRKTELDVARSAVELAGRMKAVSDGSRAAVRRSHVGYYLVDSGLSELQDRCGYRAPWRERIKAFLARNPNTFYLGGIELLTFLLVAIALQGLERLTPVLQGLLLLLIPASQAAVDFMNSVVTYLMPPSALPKLDFSEGVPPDCATLVVVPTLLMREPQVRDLVLDLEIRYLANRDANIRFALLTDSPDSDQQVDEPDELAELCRGLIEALNRRYPDSPFYLFHRHRVYNEREGRWMGWERKRGKLLDLNRLLCGGFDSFPVKAGDLSILREIRYILTLDSDTQLPRDAAAKLIGTIGHPLNAAVIDPRLRIVVEGYGILQPRIGISIQSASRSRLAALYSGETGFDIYTRAVSDVYQDLYGEGIFTGKGIYEVAILHDVLEQRFPENALLSHDLIEGAYARAALASDIELIDDYPSHFSAYNRRKHRWVRGDWQILRWLLNRVPDRALQMAPNPISVISRWKILDNLRRSLFEPSLVLLFLASWLYLPGAPGYWTFAGVALLFLPTYWALLFSLLRIPFKRRPLVAWMDDTLRAFATGHVMAFFSLVFLLHQALISIDAILRSIIRVFVTGRRLLEWETAAEAEQAAERKATVDLYLEWTPWLSSVLAVLVWRLRPAALAAAAPILVLWIGSRALSSWLNRPPRKVNRRLSATDTEWVREHAGRIFRFFNDWSSPVTNWLIPDSIHETGETAMRLSPTNLGMLLDARVAAVELELTTADEFASATRQTLAAVEALPKCRGHLFNWYDIETLEPLAPRFVSTVDSGNLAASLWTLKQAAAAMGFDDIAATCERMVSEMDFAFLFHPRKRVLSVGYDADTGRITPSYYDLLASEARIAVFVAIAKGDIPQEAWFHLGRGHTVKEGQRVLLSWTGTMFEYLMPALWMHHHPGTITQKSAGAVVRVQREYARRKGVPWGVSESACIGPGVEGYAAFGIPGLRLKPADADSLVIAPYASWLAAMIDPGAAVKNLRQIEEYGWTGRYGFYEAIDYSHAGGEPVRSWMAHHQGMSLLAICNLLTGNPIQRYFHAEPHVLATELLLHERLPSSVQGEAA